MPDRADPDAPTTSDAVAAAWGEHRQRALDVAYRMLGSVTGAEDAVQEAFARLLGEDVDAIGDVRGWLVTVTSRLCIDHLRSASVKRAAYVGPWLPEPIVDLPGVTDPADRVTLDESVRMALLVVLEALSPAERTAFVLHDLFQLPFETVGEVVGRSPEACRQLARRARQRIRRDAAATRFEVDAHEWHRVAERFAAACTDGDLHALVAVLDPGAVGEFDSGGNIPGAPTKPITGGPAIARVLVRSFKGSGAVFVTARINGEPGIAAILGGRIVTVAWLTVRGDRVEKIHAIGNPEKLKHLKPPGATSELPSAR